MTATAAKTASQRGLHVRSIISVLTVIVLWEAVARAGLAPPLFLPPFTKVISEWWAVCADGSLPLDLVVSLSRAAVGLCLATAIGVPLGIAMAHSRFLYWLFDPVVALAFPSPKVAFLPIFILWFGVFDWSKIAMVAFSSVFPVIVATWAATENVDKYLIWSAQSLGVSQRQLLWQIVLPSAMPGVFTGLQIALPISLIVVIICEMTMGGQGLGGSMMTSMRFADSPGVFSGIVAIAIVGSILVKLMELLRARLLVWHQESSGSRR